MPDEDSGLGIKSESLETMWICPEPDTTLELPDRVNKPLACPPKWDGSEACQGGMPFMGLLPRRERSSG